MRFFPAESRTLLVPLPAKEILRRIDEATLSADTTADDRRPKMFSGRVTGDGFRLALRRNRPNSFGPEVIGRIVESAEGSLLQLEYRLFTATRIYFIGCCAFALLAGLLLSFRGHALLPGASALVVVVLITWVMRTNFRMHLQLTHSSLVAVLS